MRRAKAWGMLFTDSYGVTPLPKVTCWCQDFLRLCSCSHFYSNNIQAKPRQMGLTNTQMTTATSDSHLTRFLFEPCRFQSKSWTGIKFKPPTNLRSVIQFTVFRLCQQYWPTSFPLKLSDSFKSYRGFWHRLSRSDSYRCVLYARLLDHVITLWESRQFIVRAKAETQNRLKNIKQFLIFKKKKSHDFCDRCGNPV